jgi:cytochrome d ubiquinol oxidase subunit I
MIDGRFFPTDWVAIVFNPSFLFRLAHNVNAFYITTAFVVMGVGAYLIRRNRSIPESQLMIRMALDLLILLVPIQIAIGDMHGLNTLEHQPAKIAAIEGRYDTLHPTPLTLFGIPDDAAATMRYAIEVPVLGSIILTHSTTEGIQGLKDWPADERPPVALPFFAFRIMVGIGLIMLAVAITGQVLLRRGARIFACAWFLRLAQLVAPLGFIAVIAGWVTTEVGRQPWTVYGLLRTADSVSPSLSGTDVLVSLILYVVVYLIMFPTGIAFIAGLVRKGPESEAVEETLSVEGGRPELPFRTVAAQVRAEPRSDH